MASQLKRTVTCHIRIVCYSSTVRTEEMCLLPLISTIPFSLLKEKYKTIKIPFPNINNKWKGNRHLHK
jgi:hypothetical protein